MKISWVRLYPSPLASNDHPLAIFSRDPAACISPGLDDWEDVLNPMMKKAFGWGASVEKIQSLKGLAQSGLNGLDGFYKFMGYFITRRGRRNRT